MVNIFVKIKNKFIDLSELSWTELYDLVGDNFIGFLDEDLFTLLRNPQAILSGDQTYNHYHSGKINHWLAHHPKAVIPILAVGTFLAGVRLLDAIIFKVPRHYASVSELLRKIEIDIDGQERIQTQENIEQLIDQDAEEKLNELESKINTLIEEMWEFKKKEKEEEEKKKKKEQEKLVNNITSLIEEEGKLEENEKRESEKIALIEEKQKNAARIRNLRESLLKREQLKLELEIIEELKKKQELPKKEEQKQEEASQSQPHSQPKDIEKSKAKLIKLNTLIEDCERLNKCCENLSSATEKEKKEPPYRFEVIKVKKHRFNLFKSDTEAEQEPEVDYVIAPFKKKGPDITNQLNRFERFVNFIGDNKFTQFLLKPGRASWRVGYKAAIVYWVVWMFAVLIAGLIGGTLALSVTGTAVVSTIATCGVFGIPIVFGAAYLIAHIRDALVKGRRAKQMESGVEVEDSEKDKHSLIDENYSLVTDKAEAQRIYKIVTQSYAFQLYKENLSEQYETKPEAETKGKTKDLADESEEEILRDEKNDNYAADKEVVGKGKEKDKSGQDKQTDIHVEKETATNVVPQKKLKDKLVDGLLVAWESFKGFVSGYTLGAFVAWFCSSALSALFLKIGLVAVAGALAGSIGGIPIAVLILLGVAFLGGTTYAVQNGVATSIAQKERAALIATYPELAPEKIAELQKEYKDKKKLLKAAYKENVRLYNDNVTLRDKLKTRETSNSEVIGESAGNSSSSTSSSCSEPTKKFNFKNLKTQNPAFVDSQQTLVRRIVEHIFAAVGRGGTAGFVVRSLILAGAIAIMIALFLHPFGFLTGPLGVGLLIGGAALTFGILTIIDQYCQKKQEQNAIDNLRMKKQVLENKSELADQLLIKYEKEKQNLLTEHKLLGKELSEESLSVSEKTFQTTTCGNSRSLAGNSLPTDASNDDVSKLSSPSPRVPFLAAAANGDLSTRPLSSSGGTLPSVVSNDGNSNSSNRRVNPARVSSSTFSHTFQNTRSASSLDLRSLEDETDSQNPPMRRSTSFSSLPISRNNDDQNTSNSELSSSTSDDEDKDDEGTNFGSAPGTGNTYAK